MKKVTWGILSTAKIGLQKVIPAMQQGKYCDIKGIASRDEAKAQSAAKSLGIPKAYGSYDALLADPEIQAIYNPLPNHLHVPWSIKALEAGKHVLCEKPIAMSAAEAQSLMDVARGYPDLKIMEAFMYRFHPQWAEAKSLVNAGRIGQLKTIQAFFSYFNNDPDNIRNIAEYGGGSLMDIGCYCISLSRYIFGAEPERAMGLVEMDPTFKTDYMASGILDFDCGIATFTCSTQVSHYQRVNFLGANGRIEIEIPFNAPPDRPCRLWLQQGTEIQEKVFEITDQYTIQGDLFSQAILENKTVPTLLEDAVNNMKVIEAILQSDKKGQWQTL